MVAIILSTRMALLSSLFAGGVGITHQLSFVRHLLNAHNSNIVATQKISLVWCIANLDALEWVRSWLDEIAA